MNDEEKDKLSELIEQYVESSSNYFLALHGEEDCSYHSLRDQMHRNRKQLYSYINQLIKE